MRNRRIKANVGVRYRDAEKVQNIVQEIEQMLVDHPEIDTSQSSFVNLVNFGPHSLEFMIYTFTKTTDWIPFQRIQQEVFLKTIEIIGKNGGQCALPTSTLYAPDGVRVHSS